MYMQCREASCDPLGSDLFGIRGVKEKSALSKSRSINGWDYEPPGLTVFLTPPSSPPRVGCSTEEKSAAKELDPPYRYVIPDNVIDEEDVYYRHRCTTDLTSMLIRDCMWNGHNTFGTNDASNRLDYFERFRSLTKTPPLVDCNLRITFVDPSEVWPFNLTDQLKVGNKVNDEDTKACSNDSIDEDVEVDVVGLEGAQKVVEDEEEEEGEEEAKDIDDISGNKEEKHSSPLTPNNSDDENTSRQRCSKRKRSESEDDNCIDNKRMSSGDESDQDCELGRATHNVLERKRRNELKLRFHYLRDSVPDLAGNDRAPKVAILQKAYSYITYLKIEEKRLLDEERKQRNLNAQLLQRLLKLQQNTSLSIY